MKGGNLSRHKRTKLGMLPGDVPIQTKARMLEDGVRELDSRFDPTGKIGRNCAKSYKKDVVRMANRRARRAPIESPDDS